MAFGRRMIQQCTVKQKEEDRLNQCKIRKQKHKLCSSEAFPSMEFTSSEEGMEYFVSQKIPGFGRHCFFTTSNTKLPLWWPSSSSHEGKEDYLSKIAWKMYWEQATKVNELDDCMRHVMYGKKQYAYVIIIFVPLPLFKYSRFNYVFIYTL